MPHRALPPALDTNMVEHQISSGSRLELYLTTDCPQEADHLACNGGGDDHLGFVGRRQAAIAGAQPDLCLPGDIADSLRQALSYGHGACDCRELACDRSMPSIGRSGKSQLLLEAPDGLTI